MEYTLGWKIRHTWIRGSDTTIEELFQNKWAQLKTGSSCIKHGATSALHALLLWPTLYMARHQNCMSFYIGPPCTWRDIRIACAFILAHPVHGATSELHALLYRPILYITLSSKILYTPVVQFPMTPIHRCPWQYRCHVWELDWHPMMISFPFLSVHASPGGRKSAQPIPVDKINT